MLFGLVPTQRDSSQNEEFSDAKILTSRLIKILSAIIIATAFAASAQAKPDLITSAATITSDASGQYIQNITVTVTNVCRQAVTGSTYVQVTFKQNGQPGAKAIYFIGNIVKPLKGGESHTQKFDVADKRIEVGRYVLIEVDPYKKVTEANEENNWRTLFPDGSGSTSDPTRCEK